MALTDQVILITGCSSGIGLALAEELAARGQRVFATARKPAALAGSRGPRLQQLALDVTDQTSIAEAVGRVITDAGRIDILINNAGLNAIGPLAEVPLSEARRLFDTNLLAPLALTQAVFPHMAARSHGRIVNIGSVVGLLPTPFAGAYCASKAGVHMMSEVLRMELAPFGIHVIEVQPGAVRSRIADNAAGGLDRYRRESSRYRPVFAGIQKRAGASQDRPMPAESFAREVAAEVLADKPARIVRRGRGANLYPALSKLPGPARDRVLMRQFGLSGLERSARGSGTPR